MMLLIQLTNEYTLVYTDGAATVAQGISPQA